MCKKVNKKIRVKLVVFVTARKGARHVWVLVYAMISEFRSCLGSSKVFEPGTTRQHTAGIVQHPCLSTLYYILCSSFKFLTQKT
ncbi:hypothetical protein Hanom_Chr03g00206881 [Helianthus anomalus]